MASKQPPTHVDQTFLDGERLFHRVLRRNMTPDGKATLSAFGLPDMSVNRGRFSSAAGTRQGFRPEDWGVVSITVAQMPPRESILHVAHSYTFRARHVPEPDNFSHSEIRVWRVDGNVVVLVTVRFAEQFAEDDPDKAETLSDSSALAPDFHMRWRKRLARSCRPELRPLDETV